MRSQPLRLRSRLAPVAIVAATAFTAPALFTSPAHADEIDNQRARVESITDELERLEAEAAVLAENLTIASDELTQLEADVKDAEEAVAEQEAEVDELSGNLGDVAVAAFVGGNGTLLGPMLGNAADVNNQLQRTELSRVALTEGTTTSDDLERELNQLEEDRQELEDLREEATAKREEIERKQEETEKRTAEYQQAKSAAEAELGDLIREEQERRARASELARQREAEEAARQREAEQARQQQQQQTTQSAQPAVTSSNSSSSNSTTSSSTSSNSNNNQSAAIQAPAPKPSPIPQASSLAGTAVNAAMSQQGTPYKFAAASPGVAFDCSGLTSWAWGRAGVYLPHQSAQQYASIPHVPSSAAQPGDLIFFYSPISHVAMYIGNGMMVHAPNSGSVVHTRAVNWGNVVGVGRPGG